MDKKEFINLCESMKDLYANEEYSLFKEGFDCALDMLMEVLNEKDY